MSNKKYTFKEFTDMGTRLTPLEFLEENPFDPSRPAEHFQTEDEYNATLVNYLIDRSGAMEKSIIAWG